MTRPDNFSSAGTIEARRALGFDTMRRILLVNSAISEQISPSDREGLNREKTRLLLSLFQLRKEGCAPDVVVGIGVHPSFRERPHVGSRNIVFTSFYPPENPDKVFTTGCTLNKLCEISGIPDARQFLQQAVGEYTLIPQESDEAFVLRSAFEIVTLAKLSEQARLAGDRPRDQTYRDIEAMLFEERIISFLQNDPQMARRCMSLTLVYESKSDLAKCELQVYSEGKTEGFSMILDRYPLKRLDQILRTIDTQGEFRRTLVSARLRILDHTIRRRKTYRQHLHEGGQDTKELDKEIDGLSSQKEYYMVMALSLARSGDSTIAVAVEGDAIDGIHEFARNTIWITTDNFSVLSYINRLQRFSWEKADEFIVVDTWLKESPDQKRVRISYELKSIDEAYQRAEEKQDTNRCAQLSELRSRLEQILSRT